MITMYGINNCDTVRKARRWMNENGIACHFHDYRRDGLTRTRLIQWVDRLGWEALINCRGTTWRKLPKAVRDTIDQTSAIAIMLENPAIIKRPLLVAGDCYLLGFQPVQWQVLLAS